MEVLILSYLTPTNHLAYPQSMYTPLGDHCDEHGGAVNDLIYTSQNP